MRTVGTFSALSVAVATLAVLHHGQVTAKVDLNDGGVWVTNLNLGSGRAVTAHLNYASRTLDSYTEPATNEFDVTQASNDVVLHDEKTGGVASIDTTTWQAGALARLPKGGQAVQGHDFIAVSDPNAGKVWVVPAAAADTFSDQQTPALTKAVGVRISVGKDDVVHTVTPDGKLRDIAQQGQRWVTSTEGSVPTFDSQTADVQVSAAGSTGVVLDRSDGWLAWPGHKTTVKDAATAQLQQPGDPNGRVAVETTTALLQLPLDGGSAVNTTVPSGTAIAPAALGACVYAAWQASDQYLRDCDGTASDQRKTVAEFSPQGVTDPTLEFRVNRDLIVLNDEVNGEVFLVNDNMALFHDWGPISQQIDIDEQKNADATTVQQTFQRSKTNRPPVAKDDTFGVRAGQSLTLPVLANDTDPDGDVLTATPSTAVTRLGPIQAVRNGRALRIDVPATATGGDTFTYTASDGRDHGDSTATVTLNVHPATQNAGPVQIPSRSSELTMVSRGSSEHRMLPEYEDPDGDPFWVSGVDYPKGMDGVYRADGLVKVNDDGTEPAGNRTVTVHLTDGRTETKAKLTVQVKPRDDQLPPTANADFVDALTNQQVVVSPLTNDTDPNNDPLTITKVDDVDGVQVDGDLTNGSFTVQASAPGHYYLPYKVSDGTNVAESVIRFDVTDPSGSQDKPIPDDDLAVLPPTGDTLVDVLSNDTDPLGGVLVLESVQQRDGQGVTAEVVDHDALRLHNNGLTGPVTISYVVGNGNGSSVGSVTVVPDLNPATGTPLAYADKAVVRSGDVVTVDVLANDVSPGDRPLHVDPQVEVTDGKGLGQAWVSDDKVRFKADARAGTVTLSYTVEDPDHNASSADVVLDIQPLGGSDSPPAPQVLTARVIEGGATHIAVPLDDIDPDGDSATLLGLAGAGTGADGQAAAPTKGVAQVQAGEIVYTSSGGNDGTGTDTFRYLVTDRFGKTATGTVNVGIAPPPPSNEPPIPTDDVLTVRPGRALAVPVVANDIDPEGEPLALQSDSVKPADKQTTTKTDVAEGKVDLTTPKQPGVLRYTYGVVDDVHNAATGALTVKVDPDAPLLPPVAQDDIVALSDIVGKNQITVDVLKNDSDPDGSAAILSPATTVPGVVAGDDGRLTIPLAKDQQVIVYTITDQDGLTGSAVVIVPGTDSLAAQRPVIRPDAQLPIQVKAAESVRIPVADFVAVRTGRTPSVPFTENVQPGPGFGGGKVLLDPSTLSFKADPDFSGLTSISFVVSDAKDSNDQTALTSTLTLPIQVESNGRTQPTLQVPTLEVAKDDPPVVRDVSDLASDPDPGDQAKLVFSVSDTPADLAVSLKGTELSVGTTGASREGTSRQFTLTVTDGTTAPVSKQVTVKVVGTTRPLMSVRDATVDNAKAGEPVTVDVGDYVTNPYAGEGKPIKVVSARSSGPAQVEPSGTSISITPDADYHGSLAVTYVVADASGDPARQVQGRIQVSVLGRPDAPTAVEAVATKSHTVQVDWRAPANNGSPITAYTVSWTGGTSGSQAVGNRTSLTVRDLPNNQDYVFTVVATNAVGDSDKSGPSHKARPDEVPAAPADLKLSFGDSQLQVSWSQPAYEGSPVKYYQVSYNGQIAQTTGAQTQLTLTGLTNGQNYSVQVRGINSAETETGGVPGAGPYSSSQSEHPNGVPGAPTGVSIDADGPDQDPSGTVTWNNGADNGEPITKFEVRRNGGETVSCNQLSDTSCRVSLPVGQNSTYSVRSFNRANPANGIDGWGPWSGPTEQVVGANPPGAPKNVKVVPTGTSGEAKLTFDDADKNGAESITYYSSVTGDDQVTSGQYLHNLPEGSNKEVQVWAVSVANGKKSPRSPVDSDTVNTFGACTVSVQSGGANYDSVQFNYTVTPHGRQCRFHATDGGDPADGETNNRDTTSSAAHRGNGPDQTYTFVMQVTTETLEGDPDVGENIRSDPPVTLSTAHPQFQVGNRQDYSSHCQGCSQVFVRIQGLNAAKSVYCFAAGTSGIANWSRHMTTDSGGNADWFSGGDPHVGNLYDHGESNDGFRDGTYSMGQDANGLTCNVQ